MAQMKSIDERLKELGITLPDVPTPMANYVPYTRTGDLLFLAGQGPRIGEKEFKTGKVGRDVTAEEAYDHARIAGIQLLSVARDALGDLGRVRRVVKLLGLVNASPDFQEQPRVINGCSDLFVEVFGEAGRHARSAIGAGSLPGNITVEVEAILEVE
jgi:enamine deaminase RidA (YjgF/YER057c/UK114 family)